MNSQLADFQALKRPNPRPIEIHDLSEDKVLAHAELSNINFPDRSHRVNLIIPVPALPLSHPGAYDLVVFANNQEIDRQQFVAKLRGEQGNDPSETE